MRVREIQVLLLTLALLAVAWVLLALFTSGCAEDDDDNNDNDGATDADTDADGDSDTDWDTESESENGIHYDCVDGYFGHADCYCDGLDSPGYTCEMHYDLVGAGMPLCPYEGRCCCRD